MKKNTSITLYKLVELAQIEWIHYMTAHQRKNAGKYASFTIPCGKRTSTRYMTMEDTNKYFQNWNPNSD